MLLPYGHIRHQQKYVIAIDAGAGGNQLGGHYSAGLINSHKSSLPYHDGSSARPSPIFQFSTRIPMKKDECTWDDLEGLVQIEIWQYDLYCGQYSDNTNTPWQLRYGAAQILIVIAPAMQISCANFLSF